MCGPMDDMSNPALDDVPPCRCWNPARPFATKDAKLSHQGDCPRGQRQLAEVRRLLADAMRKFR